MLLSQKKRFKDLYRGRRVGVWREQKLLYVRVPKSGNSSIMAACGGAVKDRIRPSKILKVDTEWITFSFVRNPWERIVSVFLNKVNENATSARMVDGVYQGFVDQGIPVKPVMGFDDFCTMVCNFPDKITDKHLRSQSSFLIYKGKSIVSFIGRMETMKESWSGLMLQAGIKCELPHVNQTKKTGQHYSQFYKNAATLKLVGDRYADDIRNFKYDFIRR